MAATKDSTKSTELVPFEFSETQSYVLEFGDLYMRVYTDGGQVVAPDSNTKLLLHYKGTDSSVTFTDDSPTVHTVTANGNAQIDTAQFKFDTSSGTFDGSGDYLSLSDHADFNLGQGFTLDTWIRFNSVSGIHTIYFQGDATAGDYVWWWVDHVQSTLNFRSVSAGALICSISDTWAPIADTWYHIAVVDGWNVNQVTNGDFALSTNWVHNTGWSIGSGTLNCNAAQTGLSETTQVNAITSPGTYETKFSITSYTAGSVYIALGTAGGVGTARTGAGTFTETLSPTSGNTVAFWADADFDGSIDNVSVWVSGQTSLVSVVDGAVLGSQPIFSGTLPDLDQQVELFGKATADDIFDYSDSCHVLTKVNDTTVSDTQKKWGDASIYFDGTGDALTAPDHADWDILTEDYATVDMWVRHTDHAGSECYISHYEDAGNFWDIVHTHGSGINFNAYTAAAPIITLSGGEITDTNWHHLCLVKNLNDYGIYIDGIQTGYVNDASTDTYTGLLRIGDWDGASLYFDGYMEDIRISHTNVFNATPADLTTGFSDKGETKHGAATNVGTPTYGTAKWGTSGLDLDGVGDALSWADHADWDILTKSSFTIDFWVKHADHVGAEYYMAQREDGTNLWMLYHSHGGGIKFYADGDGMVGIINPGFAQEITDTDWHHIALIKAGTAWGIYLDGVQGVYFTTSESDTFTGALNIGQRGDGQFFAGQMDEIRITHTNDFGVVPNVGLTSTLTVPTGVHTPDSNTKLLCHCELDTITIPTSRVASDSNTKLLVQADLYDCDGWADETRVSDVARWSTNFTVATTEYPAAGGSTPYEVVSPYDTDDDISLLRVLQSADTLYIAHPDYNVRKLTRQDHDDWTFSDIDWNEPPWNAVNTTATTLDPDGITGTVTVTASTSFFTTQHVGAYFRQANGFYKVTVYTNPTTVTAVVKRDLDDHVATASWEQGVWDDTQGYPTSLAFHEDRLVAVGDVSHPLRVFMSGTGDYENFGILTSPSVLDSDPLNNDVWAQKLNLLKWVYSGKRLFMGTVGSEYWMTGSGGEGNPITPSSIYAQRETGWGSSSPAPIQIGQSIIFVQKDGKKLRDWRFNNDKGGYEGIDLNILSEHLTIGTTIKKMQYAQDPNQIVWFLMADGQLASMTYLQEHNVVGFASHTSIDSTGNGLFESMAVIPGTEGDELWVTVQRTVDGNTVKYIERLQPEFFGGSITTNAFFVDSGLSTFESGDPASTFGGMEHLEGETVSVLADGVYSGEYTIASGEFTLTGGATATNVHAGLGYNMDLQMVRVVVAQVQVRRGSLRSPWSCTSLVLVQRLVLTQATCMMSWP
jgi:hypothetical protein